MGNAGGAFAQSFANTLIQGSQLIEQNKTRRDELDLRNKLASAELKKHDAEMGLLESKVRGITSLQQRMTGTDWPDSELGAGGSQAPAPLSDQERQQYTALIRPEALLDPRQEGVELFKQALAGQGGQAPAAGPAADRGAEAPADDLGPQRKLDRTLSLGSDGKLELKLGERNVQYKVDHQVMVGPDGQATIFRTVTDPEDPRRTQSTPVGRAVPPAELQKWDLAVTALGLAPGSFYHDAAVADFIYVATTTDGKARDIAFKDLQAKWTQVAAGQKASAGTPTSSSVGDITSRALTSANQQEIDQASKRATAVKKAELTVPEKATPAEREKLATNLAATDMYSQISTLYKPEYVGPYSGGVGAKIGRALGTNPQQKEQFLTALSAANNKQINALTGAGLGEKEAQRILSQQPNAQLPPTQYEARFKQAKINNKIIAIRQYQTYRDTGVDVSGMQAPPALTTEERRSVIGPIMQDLQLGQITREEAIKQLQGLAQYTPQQAQWMLDSKTFGGGGR